MNNKNIIRLPDFWIDYLTNLPESGMSFQIVNVYLKNATAFLSHKVLNSEELVLENDESIDVSDIDKIELTN